MLNLVPDLVNNTYEDMLQCFYELTFCWMVLGRRIDCLFDYTLQRDETRLPDLLWEVEG